MNVLVRIAAVVAFGFATLGSGPAEAAGQTETTPQIDPAMWGVYARLADTSRANRETFSIHWRWAEPGRVLLEEWSKAGTGKIVQTGTITVGDTAGTLVMKASTIVGDKQWNGVVQSDGSVVFFGTGLLKMNYKVVLAEDGAFELLPVKVKDGAVASVAQPDALNRYLPTAAPIPAVTAVASSAPTTPAATAVASSAPAESAASAVASSAPVAPPAQAPDTRAGAVPPDPTPKATPVAAVPIPTSRAPSAAAPGALSNAPSVASNQAGPAAVMHQGAKPSVPGKATIPSARSNDPTRVVREYFAHLIEGQGGNGRAWTAVYPTAGSEVFAYQQSGSGYRLDYRVLRSDGNLATGTGLWMIEPDGAVTLYVDAQPKRKLVMEFLGNDAYRVDTLPGYGVADDQAAMDEYVRFDGAHVFISRGDRQTEYQALEAGVAMAQQSELATELQAKIAAQRAEEERREKERHEQYVADTLHAAGFLTDEEAAAQDDSEVEERMAARRAAWDAMASQNERELAESLQNLRNTAADIEARQRAAAERAREEQAAADDARRQAEVENAERATARQEEIARQYEAQRQAEAAKRAALEVKSTSATAGTSGMAGTGAQPSGSNPGKSEALMGFLGATCEIARQNAQKWVGPGGSFRVAHERPDGSGCLVQIDFNSVVHGAGTASSQ